MADSRRDVRANLLHRIALLRRGAASITIARFYDDYTTHPGCDGAVRGHLCREVLPELAEVTVFYSRVHFFVPGPSPPGLLDPIDLAPFALY
jgi:hypothetical protein